MDPQLLDTNVQAPVGGHPDPSAAIWKVAMDGSVAWVQTAVQVVPLQVMLQVTSPDDRLHVHPDWVSVPASAMPLHVPPVAL